VKYVACILPLAVLTGCVSPIYHDGSKPPAASVSHRSRWQASGSVSNPNNAIDGNIATAALSGNSYENATLTINLGKTCVFNLVVIDHGQRAMGFCRRLAVAMSMDGKTFKHVYAASGTKRITYLWLPSPVLARYVRLQVVVPGRKPWSVAEVHLQ